MNHQQKIGIGAIVALAMIVSALPHAAALPVPATGITATCTNPEEYGHGGTSAGSTNGYHVSYVTTLGALVVGQDGCLSNAVTDTNAFFFSGGSDDGLGVSGTFLYASTAHVTLKDATTLAPLGSAGCVVHAPVDGFSGPCTYTNQGQGVSCMSPQATPHHGTDTKIFVKDAVLGGGVSFSVASDWYRSTGNAPVSSSVPPDALPPNVRALIASLPDGIGAAILFIYDNQIRSQPTPIQPGPGNDAATQPCGDGTIEPCWGDAGPNQDENQVDANNPSGCNNLDHLWIQNSSTACLHTGVSINLGKILSAVDPVAEAEAQVLADVAALQAYVPAGLLADLGNVPGCLVSATPNTWVVTAHDGGDARAFVAGTVNGNTHNTLGDIAGGDGSVAVFINDPATQVSIWTGN